jgi:hypothetical protein
VFDKRQVNFDVGDDLSFDDPDIRVLDQDGLGLPVRQEEVGTGLVSALPGSVADEFLQKWGCLVQSQAKKEHRRA